MAEKGITADNKYSGIKFHLVQVIFGRFQEPRAMEARQPKEDEKEKVEPIPPLPWASSALGIHHKAPVDQWAQDHEQSLDAAELQLRELEQAGKNLSFFPPTAEF
jgi:hypothetical protein